MSSGHRGLGRGLDALFESSTTSVGSSQNDTAPRNTDVSTLPLDALIPNPAQPRKHFDPAALQELAASIASQGLIQPILVRQVPGQIATEGPIRYEIVAGERRWRAARLAGLTKIPVYVRSLSDEDVMAAALIENLQREDLNPIEEAMAFVALRDQFSLTQEDMAKRLGKNRSTIANTLRLLQLSPAAQDDVKKGAIHAGHARALLSLTEPEAQEALRAAIAMRGLTVRDAEMAVLTWKAHKHFPWQQKPVSAHAVSETSHEPSQTPAQHGTTIVSTMSSPLSTGVDIADTLAQTGSDGDVDSLNQQPTGVQEQSAMEFAPQSSRSKSPHIKALQKSLSAELAIVTRISGSEEKGKITFSYQSPAELQQLLQRLGISQEI